MRPTKKLIPIKAQINQRLSGTSMMEYKQLSTTGLLNANVPRYTSYPTANHFSDRIGPEQYSEWISALKPGSEISFYAHIPFCERLCWYCACRTQGVNSARPVEAYLKTLTDEIDMISSLLDSSIKISHLHLGGGSPTILSPELMTELVKIISDRVPFASGMKFSVEIDPTTMTAAKYDALQAVGMTRASVGIQDFDPVVQQAIGRLQSPEVTKECVEALRNRGISSVNFDLVYGLPHQTLDRLRATLEQALSLRPDRIALFGYAHVPWMAIRQKMIDEDVLPDATARFELFNEARKLLLNAGYLQIGIDHFVLPEDALAVAAGNRQVRRNFQGYTDDSSAVLIGVGASSISQLPNGYAQNNSATSNYTKSISGGRFATARGHAFTLQDRCIGHAIDELMCYFGLSVSEIATGFGDLAVLVAADLDKVAADFSSFVSWDGDTFEILPHGRLLARVIASRLDKYFTSGTNHSLAI